MRGARHLLAILVGLAFLGPCGTPVQGAEGPRAIAIDARPVRLAPEDPRRVTVGVLHWRGGVALTAADGAFGGWSDLQISADGRRLTALGDRGAWLVATIVRDADDRITGLADAVLGPLLGPDGRPLDRRRHETDAEGLAGLPDGSLVVAFEGRHRLWRYAAAPGSVTPLAGLPRPLPGPPGLADAPVNGGLEALGGLADGSLIGFTEELRDDSGLVVGWRRDPAGAWAPLRLRPTGDFKPTGLAVVPGGDVVLAERRYTPLAGPGLRLSVITAAELTGPAPIVPHVLAVLDASLSVDNFEAVGLWQGAGGERRLVVLSDDNFNPLQRTLLLEFAWPADAPKGP